MNTLAWCEQCKEQRQHWRKRFKVLGMGWWVHDEESWLRLPKKYPWQMPRRYDHLFPDTPSFTDIDYLHDERTRDPEVARALIWVAIFIAQRKKDERFNREVAAAFDVPLDALGLTRGSYALAQEWRDEWMQQMQFTLDHMIASNPINGTGNGVRWVSAIAIDQPIINGTPTEGEK